MKARNAIKSAYRKARMSGATRLGLGPPLSLRQWARIKAKEAGGGKLRLVAQQWLSNKGCRA